MKNYRTIGLSVLIIVSAWFSGIVRAQGRLVKYLPIDTVDTATAAYNKGVDDCDRSQLSAAADTYLRVWDTLTNDSLGIGRQYKQLRPMVAYMLGWCYYRSAEISSERPLFEKSLEWFGLVPSDAQDNVGGYARIMIGEIQLWLAVTEKFDLLCSDELDSSAVSSLASRMNSSRTVFGEAVSSLGDEPAKYLATIKQNDAIYELARLYRSANLIDSTQQYYAMVNYSEAVRSSAADRPAGVRDYDRYADAMIQWEDMLLNWGAYGASDIETLQSQFRTTDRSLRVGGLYLPQAKPTQAYEQFSDAATRYAPGQPNRPLIVEAEYFRGYALLDSAVGEGLDNDAIVKTIRESRKSFESFENMVRSASLQNDPRLRQLVTRSRQKYEILGIVDGQDMPDTDLAALGREDVRFLIRLAASVVSTAGKECTDALREYFELRRNQENMVRSGRDAHTCVPAKTDTLGHNEALFLEGLAMTLEAEGADLDKPGDVFLEAARLLGSVGGNYVGEATYLRAYAMHKAEQYATADTLLRNLVSHHRSVRALYYYGFNYRDWLADSAGAEYYTRIAAAMQLVKLAIEAAGTPPEYVNFLNSANLMVDRYADYYSDEPDSVLSDIPGIELVKCPDVLTVDTIGAWTEDIVYEALREKELSRRQFAEVAREELAVYGLPKLWLNPTSRSCSQSSILGITEPFIPDSVHMDKVWRGIVQFTNHSGDTLDRVSCAATYVKTGVTIPCRDSADGYYVLNADIKTNDSASVDVSANGYYQTYFRFTAEEPGNMPHSETLARKVRYDKSGQTGSGPFGLTLNNKDAYSFNLAAHRNSQEPPPELVEHFAEDRYLRDYAYDQARNRFLAVSSQLNNGLIVYSAEGTVDTITLGPSISLNSAEGITVDRDGNIYVADWGNHRVLVLDSQGNERFSFGAVGQNHTENAGNSARLLFPNRIAVEQDTKGVDHPRQKHLLVSDWFGIHKFDERGRYLDSPVRFGPAVGSVYEITLNGYGPASELRVYDLAAEEPYLYTGQR